MRHGQRPQATLHTSHNSDIQLLSYAVICLQGKGSRENEARDNARKDPLTHFNSCSLTSFTCLLTHQQGEGSRENEACDDACKDPDRIDRYAHNYAARSCLTLSAAASHCHTSAG
jgi:hypothetical protein